MLETRTQPLAEERPAPQRPSAAAQGGPAGPAAATSELPAGQAPAEASGDRLTFSPEGLEALRREREAPDDLQGRESHATDRELRAELEQLEERRDLALLRGQDLQVRAQMRVEPRGDEPGRLADRVDYEMGPDRRRYAVGTAPAEARERVRLEREAPADDAARAARTYAGIPQEPASQRADFVA